MNTIEIKEDCKVIDANKAMLNDSYFNDVSMKNVKIINANLSGMEIENAQIGGAFIHNIGMPPEGHPMYDPKAEQRPVRFEDCNLANSNFNNCNLSGVAISNCTIKGLTINGVLIEALLNKDDNV